LLQPQGRAAGGPMPCPGRRFGLAAHQGGGLGPAHFTGFSFSSINLRKYILKIVLNLNIFKIRTISKNDILRKYEIF
jgi:hypothetical protein